MHKTAVEAWAFNRYGDASVVERMTLPDPVAGDSDILVELKAAALNPIDIKLRNGDYRYVFPARRPFILGHEGAGVIVAKGKAVSGFAIGDEVHFARPHGHNGGTLAERIAIPASVAAPKPKNLSFEEAAAIPVAGLTSWQVLHDLFCLRPGQRVFISRGTGGVGSIAIPLAKHLGGHVVTATSAKNLDFVKGLGADEVIDYTTQTVFGLSEKVDLVFDTLGPKSHRQAFSILKTGGSLISIVGPPTSESARKLGFGLLLQWACGLMSAPTMLRAKSKHVFYRFLSMSPNREQLEALARLFERSVLKPAIEAAYDFADVPAALSGVESGHARGKLIVRMGAKPQRLSAAVNGTL